MDGVTTRDGILKNHCCQTCFLTFFFNYGNYQFQNKKDETSLYVWKTISTISESPFSTFYVRSVIRNDENKMVSHHFQIHENSTGQCSKKNLSALANSIPDCYLYYLTIKKTR